MKIERIRKVEPVEKVRGGNLTKKGCNETLKEKRQNFQESLRHSNEKKDGKMSKEENIEFDSKRAQTEAYIDKLAAEMRIKHHQKIYLEQSMIVYMMENTGPRFI